MKQREQQSNLFAKNSRSRSPPPSHIILVVAGAVATEPQKKSVAPRTWLKGKTHLSPKNVRHTWMEIQNNQNTF